MRFLEPLSINNRVGCIGSRFITRRRITGDGDLRYSQVLASRESQVIHRPFFLYIKKLKKNCLRPPSRNDQKAMSEVPGITRGLQLIPRRQSLPTGRDHEHLQVEKVSDMYNAVRYRTFSYSKALRLPDGSFMRKIVFFNPFTHSARSRPIVPPPASPQGSPNYHRLLVFRTPKE